MMNNKLIKILILCLLLWLPLTVITSGVPEVANEYKIKMALVFNFLKLTAWPEAKEGEEVDETYTLGFIGSEETFEACMTLKGRTAQKKVVKLVRLTEKDLLKKDSKVLKEIDILYCAKPEYPNKQVDLKKVLKAFKNRTVLTIGETSGFLEMGGIINFFVSDNRIRFEINLDAAKTTGLTIKTSVLKLAERVIKKD